MPAPLRSPAAFVIVAVVFLGLLFLYKIWPGRVPESANFLSKMGTAYCLGIDFPSHSLRCAYNAYPNGLISSFGFPEVWLVAAFNALSPLNLLWSFRIVWALGLLAAFLGAQRLFAVATKIPWVAWGGATLYLISPIVSAQGGYGPLQLGFALVPTYLLVDLWFLRAVDGRRRAAFGIGAFVVALRVFALFTDGYSFVMALIPAATVYLLWGIRRLRVRDRRLSVLICWSTALLSVAAAYALYTAFLGVDSFAPTSTAFFRGQGVDLYPQLVPSSSLWFADLLGVHHNVRATSAYSDGRNLADVFPGWVLVVTAVAGLVVFLRAAGHKNRLIVAVAVGGVLGFLLALGPSLKAASFRAAIDLKSGIPKADDYLMPAEEAVAPTGLAWIYRNVPGINTMRALYRWELLPKIALILLAVVALTALVVRGRKILAIFVLCLLLAEALPTIPAKDAAAVRALDVVEGFDHDVVEPLRGYVHPGERALLVNPLPGGSGSNHYLANWICPQLQLRCYNVGGDKSGTLAAAGQSKNVRALLGKPKNIALSITELLESGEVAVVILVNFDLRANAAFWPAADSARTAAQAAGRLLNSEPGLKFAESYWFTTVRLA